MEQAVKRMDASFSVSGQLNPGDLPEVKAQGFRTVICNRPDHEGGSDQPDHQAMERAAAASGIAFRYLPISTSGATPDQARELKSWLDALPSPILA